MVKGRTMKMEEKGWRRVIFWYELAILVGLLLLALVYLRQGKLYDWVPKSAQGLPVEVAWFGALGGVVISLKGVYDHPLPGATRVKSDWDNRWVLWHLGRPFSGVVAGLVTLLLLKVIYPSGTPATAVVLAAAFILGLQEKRFFDFLNQIGSVIVAVPKKDEDGGGNDQTGTQAGQTPPSPTGTQAGQTPPNPTGNP